MIGIFTADDFLALCMNYSSFLDLIGQMIARVLILLGVDVPSLVPVCRDVFNAISP
ncbi:MAG: hypothetical protein ACE5F9_06345 [Phycisphaerae bacterium]